MAASWQWPDHLTPLGLRRAISLADFLTSNAIIFIVGYRHGSKCGGLAAPLRKHHVISCRSRVLHPVGEWLSLVEHLVRDQGVGGSNPLSPTIQINRLHSHRIMHGSLVQGRHWGRNSSSVQLTVETGFRVHSFPSAVIVDVHNPCLESACRDRSWS